MELKLSTLTKNERAHKTEMEIPGQTASNEGGERSRSEEEPTPLCVWQRGQNANPPMCGLQ